MIIRKPVGYRKHRHRCWLPESQEHDIGTIWMCEECRRVYRCSESWGDEGWGYTPHAWHRRLLTGWWYRRRYV